MLSSLQGSFPPAILALADGTVFIGNSIGATGATVGEVVFNTSMTGYQEILTDPSYCQQIVTLTYPHIGNYGTNAEDIEADKIHAAGLIIKDLPLLESNFRSNASLSQYLVAGKTVAIANIDTRKLTRHLRTKGAQNGAIVALASGAKTFKMKFGHHGANHPVKDLDNGRVSITSQNHGFAVDEKTLPANLRATHVSLFDGTLQGLARTDKPAFCFQGHPEASPGPHDIGYLFDRFTQSMEKFKAEASNA